MKADEKEAQRKEIYVYLELIHIVARQKPMQHCKATILQLQKTKELPVLHVSFPPESQRMPKDRS